MVQIRREVAVERRERLHSSGQVPKADVAIGADHDHAARRRAASTLEWWEICTSPEPRRSSRASDAAVLWEGSEGGGVPPPPSARQRIAMGATVEPVPP